MAKTNSIPMRTDPNFKKMIEQTQAKYLMKGRRVQTARITLGIFRQYNNNPNLLKELEDGIK